MKKDFFKFPATPHLAIIGGDPVRDDKVLTNEEREEFLQNQLVVEEKVDGANLGISFDSSGNIRAQNRGSYLQSPYRGQWKKLSEWLEPKMEPLFEGLSDRYILFAEWCYAQHSIFYDRLPDWLLGFDILDINSRKFLSISKRNRIFSDLGISQVPRIGRGHFSLSELKNLMSQSRLRDNTPEGLYLRFDKGDWLEQRAKLVRPEFLQSLEKHWSRRNMRANRLKIEARV